MLYPRLKEAIEAESGLPVYGFLPDCPDCGLESRHLGLVTASEVQNLRAKLERLSQLAEEHLDLEGLLALAAGAPPLPVSSVSAVPGVSGRPRIAVARDGIS